MSYLITLIAIVLLTAIGLMDGLHMHAQMVGFVVGVGLVARGLGGFRRVSARDRRRTQVLAVAIVTLLGFGLRLVNLEGSVHIWIDEGHFFDGITRLWDDPRRSLLSPMSHIASFTWFYSYLASFSVDLFGTTLAAPRMVSVVFGTLTIPAVYTLTRLYADRMTALLAALVLATFPPHMHFSRLALNNIVDPFFGVLALLFFVRGLRSGRRGDFVLAGVMLGLTQYWYEGGKLIFPAMLLTGVLFNLRRLSRQNIAVMGAAFALTVLPLALTLLRTGSAYLPRLSREGSAGDLLRSFLLGEGVDPFVAYLTDGLLPALTHLTHHPDGAIYYGGNTGLILPHLLPFFLIGLVVMVFRRKGLLLVPIVFTVLGNSLITHPDWSARFVVILPFLAILLAVGLQAAGRLLAASITRRPALIYGVIVLLLCIQVIYYFGPHLALYNQQVRPFRDHQDVAWRAKDFPPGTHVFLFSDELVFYEHFEVYGRYWGRDLNVQSLHPQHLLIRGVNRLPNDADLAFFIQPHRRDLLHLLAQSFALPRPQYSPYNLPMDKQYVLYYVGKDG